jgi:hypothetical protein
MASRLLHKKSVIWFMLPWLASNVQYDYLCRSIISSCSSSNGSGRNAYQLLPVLRLPRVSADNRVSWGGPLRDVIHFMCMW